MFQTRQRKILFGVLAIAVAALAIDRMVMQGPQSAEGSTSESQYMDTVAELGQQSAPTVAVAPKIAAPNRSVADLLMQFRGQVPQQPQQIENAFVPSPTWIDADQQLTAKVTTANPAEDRARQFVQDHTLTAVMRTGDGGFAIVNNTIVRLGQTLGGFELIEITADAAVFRGNDYQVQLKVKYADR